MRLMNPYVRLVNPSIYNIVLCVNMGGRVDCKYKFVNNIA